MQQRRSGHCAAGELSGMTRKLDWPGRFPNAGSKTAPRACRNAAHVCILAVAMATALSGCIIPETFNITLDLDGYAYHLKAHSRIANAMALAQIQKGHKLSEKDNAQLKAEETKAAGMPGFRRFEYVGGGRYDLDLDLSGTLDKPGATIGFPNTKNGASKDNFLTIKRLADGSIEIHSPQLSDTMRKDLTKLVPVPNGMVTVHTNGKVVTTNADKRPRWLGGDYRWIFNRWDKTISMKIVPNAN